MAILGREREALRGTLAKAGVTLETADKLLDALTPEALALLRKAGLLLDTAQDMAADAHGVVQDVDKLVDGLASLPDDYKAIVKVVLRVLVGAERGVIFRASRILEAGERIAARLEKGEKIALEDITAGLSLRLANK